MISRYTRPEMGRIWSDENRFTRWLEVEIAVCNVLAELGEIPADAAAEIAERASFSVDRIREIEKETSHDVVAFTTAVAETVGESSRFLHLGLTSTDVVDTGQALQIREAAALIEAEILRLLEVLRKQAFRYKNTLMVGRTHGVHAEPTTLGLKLAVWYSELERNLARFRRAREVVEIGKISGPVGTFSHLPPVVEERVCEKLRLPFALASTQIIQRDRHAEFVFSLALIGSTYDKIATEIRHLQRTEVSELREPFGKSQKGSSAMPHKRNPVSCEQISGLARVLRSHASVALENVTLWHERDISHSSAERVILPDSTILVHYLTARLRWVLENMVVDEERMGRNLNLTRGLIHSGALLLELARKGALREEAYKWVQLQALKAWDEGLEFRDLVAADPQITALLSEGDLDRIFDVKYKLRHIDTVFERVFGSREEAIDIERSH